MAPFCRSARAAIRRLSARARPGPIEAAGRGACWSRRSAAAPAFHLAPAAVQDRLGIAVGLRPALEHEIAGRLRGDAALGLAAPPAGPDRSRRVSCRACVSPRAGGGAGSARWSRSAAPGAAATGSRLPARRYCSWVGPHRPVGPELRRAGQLPRRRFTSRRRRCRIGAMEPSAAPGAGPRDRGPPARRCCSWVGRHSAGRSRLVARVKLAPRLRFTSRRRRAGSARCSRRAAPGPGDTKIAGRLERDAAGEIGRHRAVVGIAIRCKPRLAST